MRSTVDMRVQAADNPLPGAVEQAPHSRHRALGRPVRTAVTSVVALVMLAVALVLGFGPGTVARQLELSFVRQPTPFTELYFADPAAVTSPGHGGSTFTFAVHSHELREVTYRYEVTVQAAGTTTTIDTGSLTLSPGGVATRTVALPVQAGGTRFTATVRLIDRPESIDFIGVA
jgi:hypothetical protein